MISVGLGRHCGGIELQPFKTFRPNRAEDGANQKLLLIGPDLVSRKSRLTVKGGTAGDLDRFLKSV